MPSSLIAFLRPLEFRPVLISLVFLIASWAGVAKAFEPFVVRDIRVEGLQRTEPGTVFGYLPVKVGDTLTDERAAVAVKALFNAGLFRDVRLEVDNGILVVTVEERPTIGSVSITGTKEFEQDALKKTLREAGLGESRVFDRALLDRAEQELKRQYLTRGFYGVRVTSTVAPLERNRVAVTLTVDEGQTARIAQIRIIGNRAFKDGELRDQFKLSEPTWFSWYTKNDKYSREKLTADLEALRSFYLDRGYLEFSVDSTQVSIDPERRGVFITIAINEGLSYRIKGFRFSGDTMGREPDLRKLIRLKDGEPYVGTRMTESTKAMTDLFGQLGYAFASVNAVPQPDRERREVEFEIMVDPGRRAYVRRIEISGNARTRDEVIRRELRQFESSWYDADSLRRSRERVDRLGYFNSVEVDTRGIPDSPDLVDLEVKVKERPTGNLMLGAGFSSTDKLILSGSINQQNFLGTGKALAIDANTSRLSRAIGVGYVDPYITPDGISRAINVSTRLFNAQALALGDYRLRTSAAGVRFGIPYTDVDRLLIGASVEQNAYLLGPLAPLRLLDTVNAVGEHPTAFLGTVGWVRDTRDSGLAPSRGELRSASIEATLPITDLQYWRGTYQHQVFFPLTKDYTLALNGDLGIGQAFGGRLYPQFKNFYAGGIGSIRGFTPSSLGRRYLDGVPSGGQVRIVGNAEFLFPLPGSGADRTLRTFLYLDVGNVYSTLEEVDLSTLRVSTGAGLSWLSPVGPIKFSIGTPIRREPTDRVQRFQFQVGTGF